LLFDVWDWDVSGVGVNEKGQAAVVVHEAATLRVVVGRWFGSDDFVEGLSFLWEVCLIFMTMTFI